MSRSLAALLLLVGLVACRPESDLQCPGCQADAGAEVGTDPLPDDGTFRVAEWNLEFFGFVGMGPGDEAVQASNVTSVMERIDADVWALEEVCDEDLFRQVLARIEADGKGEYGLVLANDPTLGNPDPGFAGSWGQKTAVVYRKSRVAVLEAQLVQRPGWDEDFVGRRPLEVKLRLGGEGDVGRELYFLVVHLKAGAEASSYDRRRQAAADLKAYLDEVRPADAVYVAGDWNDDLDESISCGSGTCSPTPFEGFLDDPAHYHFPTQVFDPDQPTTVGYDSAIDHHLISDELFGDLVDGSPVVIHPGIYDYAKSTSDHYPTVVRYRLP